MNKKLTQLEQWGCDIHGALPRFLNDEAFMLECIQLVAEDPAFAALGEALRLKRSKEAFDAAHTLKGILANTGLTPLLALSVKIVEPLRKGDMNGLEPVYDALMDRLTQLRRLL